MRLTDNLYMLSGSAYGVIGNVYAIVNDQKMIMIDCGQDQTGLDTILWSLNYHGLEKLPITHMLITHMHIDHTGNAWYFAEQGTKIIAGASDANGIEQGGVLVNDFGMENYTTCKVDTRLEGDCEFTLNGIDFKAWHMPGHTNGGMFYTFTLDHLSMVATGDTVFPEPARFDKGLAAALGWEGSYEFDRKKYMQSLERALQIKAQVLLGGHGMPIMRNGSHVIGLGYKKTLKEYR